jgi:hypothetical protein
VSAAPAAAQQSASAPEGQARELFDRLNQARQQQGLPPLKWDEQLAEAARRHTQGMAQSGQLTHDLPGEPALRQRLSAVPLDRSGENVANNTDFSRIHPAFMASPPHRANILNQRYTEVGIAVAKQGDLYWVTEDFAHTIVKVSDNSAEEQVSQAFEELRRRAGAPPLTEVHSASLHQMACQIADGGQLKTASALRLPQARNAVVYTSINPGQLPGDAQRLRNTRDVSSYGVGACFKRTPQYPSGVYWVVLVLFGNR